MKKTKNILKALDYTILGELPDKITSIHNNSKEVKPGSLFFAIKGTKVDGHKYIPEAIKNGAEAIILEDKQDQLEVPQIIVEDSRSALSKVAKSFYDDPSSQLKVVGITGTNGKTSVVYILHKIFISSGIKAGKIGTLGYTIGQNDFECSLTTPGIIELQKIFKKMVNNNVKVVAMEVSSHALALGRVNDITFSGACFTNLSQDHLDFHKTMQAYANAKAKLFSMLNKDGFAICNIDSDYSEMFIKNCSAQLLTYSLAGDADYTWSEGTTFHNSIEGIVTTPKSKIKINAPLAGKFNLQNVLAAVAISDKLAITTN
ncbi:MAG: UDP-N-acetylmuramoyl-L-alanyl-D-glutamate--2,6-diaminopimelate ligase, partial [Candidatus Marinimicrobia bacterium]|nr:UDP-N-acetylmuramoyl-L-alanyl-D-glutamate--2,6-diaminopimelate ligase [Candidatus Neomarinimicrobiota bacterium]